ncbi:MAG: efflux RND transporter periplasmic adaptor subunit [Bacteroidota bacterium]
MKRKYTILVSVAILLIAGVIAWIIFLTEPSAQREAASRQTAMLVKTISVEKGSYQPAFQALGTVRPAKEIILSPRVSGEITELSKNFVPGGHVKKGEKLIQIDPSDYQNTLQQRKSELKQAQADLNMEMGRQRVAQKDYELSEQTLTGAEKDLVLRKPQLNTARAQVLSAETALEQAKLDLQRTAIKAPFDAHIVSREVNTGSQVSRGQTLARLVGLENYWVEATLPLSKMQWISFPENDKAPGSLVQVRNRTAWLPDMYREGRVFRMIGSLEDRTRLARFLIEVENPLRKNPPLMLGEFVENIIKGDSISGVVKLNRDYVRKNNTVWVMENAKLSIRDVQIVIKDANHAYIEKGLHDGDSVVTTNLSTVTDGAPLRLEADTTSNQ